MSQKLNIHILEYWTELFFFFFNNVMVCDFKNHEPSDAGAYKKTANAPRRLSSACRALAAVRYERVCCRPETSGSVWGFGGRCRRLRGSRYGFTHSHIHAAPASFHRCGLQHRSHFDIRLLCMKRHKFDSLDNLASFPTLASGVYTL